MSSIDKIAALFAAIAAGHYGRNLLNKPGEATQPMPDSKSVFHKQGAPDNTKYVSPDGRHEAVRTPDGTLVGDHRNVGTYNYASPNTLGGVPHAILDVAPYMLLGNTPRDMLDPSRFRTAVDAMRKR